MTGPQVEQLPLDFAIVKLRGGFYIFAADDFGRRKFLQRDGSWGDECDQVFDTREEAEQRLPAEAKR